MVGAFLLQGCAPGFGVTAPYDPFQELPAEFQYFPADGAADGLIMSISPALINSLSSLDKKRIPPDVEALFGEAPVYTIGSGDVVGVIVYDHPELLPNGGAIISQSVDPTGITSAPGFIVDATGQISYPYIGRIKLSGLTEIEASDLIAKKISGYIKDPQVTVRIVSFRSRRAFVEGEVKNPGLQIFTDIPMTLSEAISRAGGITPDGDRSYVTLSRGGKTVLINLERLRDSGADGRSIPLQNGDSILIRNRDESKVFVMGEVLRPSALLMHSGRLTLNEALGEAGGPNLATAQTSQIYVIRSSARAVPTIFHLNAKNPAALALAEKFPLDPKDVVYIDPVPMVTWSRLVSLILPSAQVLNAGDQVWARHR